MRLLRLTTKNTKKIFTYILQISPGLDNIVSEFQINNSNLIAVVIYETKNNLDK